MKFLSFLMLGVFAINLEIQMAQSDYVREFGGPRSNSFAHGGRMKKPVRDVPQKNHPTETNAVEEPEEQEEPEQSGEPVPIWILERLDDIDDPMDFLSEFVEGDVNVTDPRTMTVSVEGAITVGASQDPNGGVEGRNAIIEPDGGPTFATPAGCHPQPTVVPLHDTYKPRVIVYPKCTIVNRCQGCCHLASNSCQPKRKEKTYVRVIKAEYVGGGRKLQYLGKYTVELEEHRECACSCKVQPEDCTRWQKHNPYTCHCDCEDVDAKIQCLQNKENRVWEEASCMCRCREERPCSSGMYYDHDECKCKSLIGLPDGHPRARHAFLEEMDNETQTTTTLPPPWYSSKRPSTTSSTTPTTSTTTTTTATTPQHINRPGSGNHISMDYLRRLRIIKERQRRRGGDN